MQAAFTYADMRPGCTDRDKRNSIRMAAFDRFPETVPPAQWWAVRIFVEKSGRRPFDIENVPKLVIDAFCAKQIAKDGTTDKFGALGLYPDDTVDYVRLMQVFGERSINGDRMSVDIFAYAG